MCAPLGLLGSWTWEQAQAHVLGFWPANLEDNCPQTSTNITLSYLSFLCFLHLQITNDKCCLSNSNDYHGDYRIKSCQSIRSVLPRIVFLDVNRFPVSGNIEFRPDCQPAGHRGNAQASPHQRVPEKLWSPASFIVRYLLFRGGACQHMNNSFSRLFWEHWLSRWLNTSYRALSTDGYF